MGLSGIAGGGFMNLTMQSGSEHDRRPAVGVAHVVLQTDRMEESARFMRTIGMRPIFDRSEEHTSELQSPI